MSNIKEEKQNEQSKKYDKKLKINTSLDDVLKASVPKKNEKKSS
ncbi:hypothetical protein SAMN05192545_3085 [Maribacter dokdonensis]|uniref:Uncharacterized protein n=1 Tax=Maribacter dokdonensis TaxID=320912 RepID=A0ABY0UV93_9FLAO|nr:hypothetical protein SAMN05192545_3085 [Maribacter dokdonensis]